MTSHDLLLVLGILIACGALPAIFGALADGRSPRVAAVMVVLGGGLVVFAASQRPGGYTLADVPNAFVRVLAHYLP